MPGLSCRIRDLHLPTRTLSCGMWDPGPRPWIEPGHWERGVLATGPAGKSPYIRLLQHTHTHWFYARLLGKNKNETRSWGPGKGKQRRSPGVCLCRGSAVGARCCPDEPQTGYFECSCGESAALPSIPRPFVYVWLSPHKQPQWNLHPEYEGKSRSYSIFDFVS